MKYVNDVSNFTVPNFLNWHYCKFIRFGEKTLSFVMSNNNPNYYATSLLH